MKYICHEATFELPAALVDRSVNMLMSADGAGVSYVITRDYLLEEENLDSFIARQLKDLSRQVSKFKELSRSPVMLGQPGGQCTGQYIESSFRQNGKEIHQRQVAALLSDGQRVLILTASAFRPFTAQDLKDWQKALLSCTLQ